VESYHSDSMDLMKNTELESLVLELIVVGVGVLSTLEAQMSEDM